MIQTISLCSHCYKKIPAFIYPENGQAWMKKTCSVHGETIALVEKSWNHFSAFYRYGTMGRNNSIIVHIWNKCNMKCPWCYYGEDTLYTQRELDALLYEPYRGMQPQPFSLMFSGGEPTERPDYNDFVTRAYFAGWNPSTITNMINLANEDFFKDTFHPAWIDEQTSYYRFACSFQHPKNYSEDIYKLKLKAMENIASESLIASCVMFSIQDLDELPWIREFYDEYRQHIGMLRIRTMFHNWRNKGDQQIFQSELYEAFMEIFGPEYTPVQSSEVEQSTAYGMYLKTCECRHISLMAAPTVENIDYHLASRPVYMLGPDLRCYSVPIAQCIYEGIEKGWKDGFRIKEA